MLTIYVVIFCGAIVQDLLWRKVKNIYVVAAFFAAFLFQISQIGIIASLSLYSNFLLAFTIGIILYLIKTLGAGDVKIFAATSILLPIENIPTIYFYSLFWGGIFGIIRHLLSGKVVTNLKNQPKQPMQAIPFTVAFLLGGMTDFTLRSHGLSFL